MLGRGRSFRERGASVFAEEVACEGTGRHRKLRLIEAIVGVIVGIPTMGIDDAVLRTIPGRRRWVASDRGTAGRFPSGPGK